MPVERASEFTAFLDGFRKVLGKDFKRFVLVETNAHEGPVYVAGEHALYFTPAPEPGPKNIAIMRLALNGKRFPFRPGKLEVVRKPSNMANGMSLDRRGRLLICEQGRLDERARISRINLKTRALETIVDAWRGLPFNSPNDVVERSDGTIWFTDPNYGELQGFKPAAKIGAYVETGSLQRFRQATPMASRSTRRAEFTRRLPRAFKSSRPMPTYSES